jgi:hypothetical protein
MVKTSLFAVPYAPPIQSEGFLQRLECHINEFGQLLTGMKVKAADASPCHRIIGTNDSGNP